MTSPGLTPRRACWYSAGVATRVDVWADAAPAHSKAAASANLDNMMASPSGPLWRGLVRGSGPAEEGYQGGDQRQPLGRKKINKFADQLV
ncbi:hypothetical protein D3C87_1176940 [compost metagenome]